MKTIWSKTCAIENRSPLFTNKKTEIAVIGAGLAGILIAFELQKAGKQVIVLESKQIGSGQTSHTTAKITSQHGLIYHSLIQHFGIDKARQYAIANEKAIEQYKLLIQKEQIACDFEEKNSYVYSDSTQRLLLEKEAVQKLGLPFTFVDPTFIPLPSKGGIKFESQGQFHPLKFMNHLSRSLEIYENTPVLSVNEEEIQTIYGSISAEKIIFATHFPFVNFPGLYFIRMHQERSYVIALKNAPDVHGIFLGEGKDGYSLRNYKDLLFFGGEKHRCGMFPNESPYDCLRKKAKEFFPSSYEVGHWSAQDCMTSDSIPYIGLYSKKSPNWYVATGFQKWGMTTSMVAATLLRDQICGIQNPFSDIFSPSRFASSDLGNILKEGGVATKGLLKRTFQIPKSVTDDIPYGEGGIVSFSNKKIGIYKDFDGNIYPVTIRCPHLGCQLEWNPDEKSWDCPCHGSRFDYLGECISNPAQTNISI